MRNINLDLEKMFGREVAIKYMYRDGSEPNSQIGSKDKDLMRREERSKLTKMLQYIQNL